jgi:hypothetical protein
MGNLRTAIGDAFRLRYLLECQLVTLLTEAEKRDHIKWWQRQTGYRVFSETGTFLGKTTLAMADVFDRCYTIEYDPALYEKAKASFAGRDNITAYLGDSGKLLGEILGMMSEPGIFWLDAHYSGGITGRAKADTPIERELSVIFSHAVKRHVILIDDARLFIGRHNYPRIRSLVQLAARNGYKLKIRDDIIRIYQDDL